MAISHVKMQTYEPLLSGELRNLPDIHFTDMSSDLSLAVDSIVSLVASHMGDISEDEQAADTEQKDEMIVRRVLRTYQKLKHDPAYEANFSKLAGISTHLGENIQRVFSILKNRVRPKVDDLKIQVEALTQVNMESMNISMEDFSSKPNFKLMTWNKFYSPFGGFEQIQESLKAELGFTPHPSFTDVYSALTSMDLETEQITLDEETKEDIEERVEDTAAPEQKEDVEEAIEVVTDKYAFKRMLAETASAAINSTDLMPILAKCEHVICKLYPCFRHLEHTPLNVTDAVLEKLHDNLKKVMKAVNIIGLTCGAIDQHYKDAYVMSEDTINSDNEPEDTEAAKAKHEQAMKHVLAWYHQRGIAVPTKGIRMQEIEEKDKDTEEMYAQLVSSRTNEAKIILNRAKRNALAQVCDGYLMTVPDEDLPEDTTPNEFKLMNMQNARIAVNTFQDTNNIEHALYKFVIDSTYGLPAVQKAHDLFGKEVIRQMEADPEMDEESEQMIYTTVGAKLISDYIASQLITKN